MNLLIVDDHPSNLKLLRAELEAEGHAVFDAADGVDALAVLERQPVDAVISDILMPRMDGYRLCHEIRRNDRRSDLPVIIYTATYNSPADEKLALDVGADKYLKKPASIEAIIAALHEVIARPHHPARPGAMPEVEVLKEYSERLVNKLEQKNTELTAAEAKFRPLVEQSLTGIYVIQDERFVYVNPRMAEIFGRSEEELTARTLYDFIVPEDRARSRENIRRRISGEVPSIHYQLRMLHQSGAVLQVEVHGSRTDYHGRPAVMGTLLDISERQRAEEALRQSEARFVKAFQSNPAAMCITTIKEGRFIEVNERYCRLFGHAREELIDRTSLEMGLWADSAKRAMLVERLQARGFIRDYETRFRQMDGRLLDAEISMELIDFPGEREPVIVSMFTDITERKRAEERLAAERTLLRTLVDHLPAGVFVKDTAGRYLLINEVHRRQLGLGADTEILGKTSFDFFPEEIARRFEADDQTVIQTGQPVVEREEPYDAGGERGWFLTTKAPLRDAQGALTGLIGIALDITQRKQAADALAQRAAELEHFHRLSVGRELKMIELKKEVNELAGQFGRTPPYDLDFLAARQPPPNSPRIP